jgi:hypothetical protein
MGLFGKILNKLGIKKDKKEAAATSTAMGKKSSASAPAAKGTAGTKPATAKKAPVASRPAARDMGAMPKGKPSAPAPEKMEMVDVMGKLETMAEGTNLKWKVSIVDLLKVLDIDSSLAARKELAEELGCPPELMGGDSAKMNVWLHKKVLAEIAENGGNIPQELLD